MKKLSLGVALLILTGAVFALSVNPSLDGRVAVAANNVFPSGGYYGKAPGYLPGDTVVVTNHINGLTAEVLILGTQDASEGVAILISPEAAEKLQIEKGKDIYVNVQKKVAVPYEKSLMTKNSKKAESNSNVVDPDRSSEVLPGNIEKNIANKKNSKRQKIEEPVEEPVIEEIQPEEDTSTEEIAEETLTEPVAEEEISEEIAETEKTPDIEEVPAEEVAKTEEVVKTEEAPEIEEIATEIGEEIPVEEAPAEEFDLVDEIAQDILIPEEKVEEESIELVEIDEEPSEELIPYEEETVAKDEIVEIEETEDVFAPVAEEVELADVPAVEDEDKIEVVEDLPVEQELADIQSYDEAEVIDFVDLVDDENTELAADYVEEIPDENLKDFVKPVEDEIELAEVPFSSENEEVIVVLEEVEPVYPEPVVLEEGSDAKGVFEQLMGENVDVETSVENNESSESEIENEIAEEPVSKVEPVEVAENEKIEEEIPEDASFDIRHKNIIYDSFGNLPLSREIKSKTYYVQVSTMANEDGLENVIGKYGEKYPVKLLSRGDSSYQVLVGPLNDDEYEVVLARLRGNFKDAFLRIK
ncbi:MAG: SPOR domain-containing protein [Treponemataceae bacterium]|nr:SPOR domain-containing protein [Treponemataceae bacterium]